MNIVLRLFSDLGTAPADYQGKTLRHLPCRRVQCNEIWQFCYAKTKNVPAAKQRKFGSGNVRTWVALDADTQPVPSFMVGNRNFQSARMFIDDLASRQASRVQLITDGWKAYLSAVEGSFGAAIDYAMLNEIYTSSQEETRYSPAQCIGWQRLGIGGKPDPRHVSTLFMERQNLPMRMPMRRFPRPTNAFSERVENLQHAVALHYMWYSLRGFTGP